MIYFCYFLIAFLIIRLLVAALNYFSFAYLPKPLLLRDESTVSILIPARNEADNLEHLLQQLSEFEYSNLQILVYNDFSTDNTAHVVESWMQKNAKIELINGNELPKGWLGKNYACHQLANAASGEILLFLDADVNVRNGLVERALTHFQKHNLHLLSIFPKQVFKSLGEKISVPLMNWILLSLLPLVLIRKSKNEAFSAANGQFMMFKSATYKNIWPHELCKNHKVEDIAIIRLFKQKKYICDTLLGDKDITCRMYNGLPDAVEGFTKNIFQFFGNSILVTVVFGIITTIAPVWVFLSFGTFGALIYLAGILFIRVFVSLASCQSVIQNLLFALPQHLIFLKIIIKGIVNQKQRKLIWKGRNILQN